MKMRKKLLMIIFIAVSCFIGTAAAQAGLFDKLTAAAEKLKAGAGSGASPSGAAAEDPDHPLHLEDHYKGHCNGQGGATCLDYGDVMDQCMAPLKGYRMKVLGDVIEKKLKTEKLSDQQRKNLQEDLSAAREAQKNKSDDPTIAGVKKSQRYLEDISEEDQVYMNAEYNKFNSKISNKCIGADHMGVGHRTEFSTGEGISGEEAVAQLRAEKKKQRAPMDCMKGVTGVRYKIMAEMTEKKMQGMKLSDKERAQWEEDVAALKKAADSGGTAMPQVNDPTNPYRPMTRLSSAQEMTEVNQEYAKRSQEEMAKCTTPEQNQRFADLDAMHENRRKQREAERNGTATTSFNAKVLEGIKGADWGKQVTCAGPNTATCMNGLDDYSNCMNQTKGYYYRLVAAALQDRLDHGSGLSSGDRSALGADIANVKGGISGGNVTDQHWLTWLNPQDQQAINNANNKFTTNIRNDCESRFGGMARYSSGGKKR